MNSKTYGLIWHTFLRSKIDGSVFALNQNSVVLTGEINADKAALYAFISQHRCCVISTISAARAPEAAYVYFAATRELELIFYAIQTTRKVINLRHEPRIAAVIGFDSEQTLQYEGIADEPQYKELDEVKSLFLEALPDRANRFGWPGLTFFRVRPTWIRFSNYDEPWHINEWSFPNSTVPWALRNNAGRK